MIRAALYEYELATGLLSGLIPPNSVPILWFSRRASPGLTGSVIWWFRLNPAQQTVDQQGGFGNSGGNDIYPAIIEDAYGNDYFVYDEADPSNYPNTRVQSVNTSGTATGWITLHGSSDQSETYIQLESGSTNLSRWGDHSGAAIEPTDNAEIWTVGEFELNSTTWGSWIGEGHSEATRRADGRKLIRPQQTVADR